MVALLFSQYKAQCSGDAACSTEQLSAGGATGLGRHPGGLVEKGERGQECSSGRLVVLLAVTGGVSVARPCSPTGAIRHPPTRDAP